MGNNMSPQQRDMMYQRDMMNKGRKHMHTRNMERNCNCDMNEPCMMPRIPERCEDGCDRNQNRNRCDDDCSRGRDMLYGMPLAMGYVPWQNFECTYEPAQALQAGTIFPELDKPFFGRRGMRL